MEIVNIWLKSFIPHNYALAEVVKGTGKHSGKTMIHLPTPIKSSFLTNQRGFNADIDAPARMHSEIEIDLTNPRIRNEVQKCYTTTEVDPDTGEELYHGHGKTDRMHFSPLEVNGNVLSVTLKASASNPCICMASFDLAPSQDYFGTLTLNSA